MFWTCPVLAQFWTNVFDLINTRLQLSLPMTPKLALLGIHDEQQPRYTKLLISYMLYYAKKEFLDGPLPLPFPCLIGISARHGAANVQINLS